MRVLFGLLALLLVVGGCGRDDPEQEAAERRAEERAARERREQIETEQIVRRLETVEEDEDQVIELLDELSWVGHPDALEALSERISDPREEVAIQAAIALSEMGGPASVRALGRAFELPGRVEVKLKAIEGLHYVGYEDVQGATDVLLRALDDPDAEVRGEAVEALLLLDEPAALATLRKVYADERQPERVRRGVASVLLDLGELPEEEAP